MEEWKPALIMSIAAVVVVATMPVACTVQERNRNNAVVDMVRAGADPLVAMCATAKAPSTTPDSVCVLTAARLNPPKEPK